MMPRYLVFLLMIMLSGCTKEQPRIETAPEKPAPATQKIAIPEFDGQNAYQYLTAQCNFGPRNPGSNGHSNCLAYLRNEMQKYAGAVDLQNFSMTGYGGEQLNLTNIVSSFNLQATKRFLLIAHWDTRPRADQEKDVKKQSRPILGANDGASGVAVLLEMARQFKASPPPVGVDILFVDGEDYGKEGDTEHYLLGARYFAQHMQPGFVPVWGILLDMIGDKELQIKRERFSMKYAPDVVDLVWSTAHELGAGQFSDELQAWVTDDHLPLNDAGVKTIDLIDFAYPDSTNSYWHTLQDTPDKCSAASLEAVGKVLMTVLYRQTP